MSATGTGAGVLRPPATSAAVLVAGNLVPLWAVLTDRMSMGDVFIVYWLENVAVWAITIVKVLTAQGADDGSGPRRLTVDGRPVAVLGRPAKAAFFAVHYGIFTLVHGIFAMAMAGLAGGRLHPASWLVAGLALVLSHAASLGLNWFGEGERWRVSVGRATMMPYPRMLVLHVAIIASFGLVLSATGDGGGSDVLTQTMPVLILLGLKTVVDLLLHLRERRRAGE